MSDTSRLFTALILSMATIFAWNYFFEKPEVNSKAAITSQQNSASSQNTSIVKPESLQPQATAPNSVKQPASPAENVTSQLNNFSSLDRTKVIEDGFETKQRIKISTEMLHGSINLAGGMVDDLSLAKYRQELDKNSPEVVLLSPRKTINQYFLNSSWLASDTGLAVPNDNTIWQIESGKELTSETPVTIAYDNGAGLIFRKTFSIDKDYMITLNQSVENKTSANVAIAPFGLINRSYDTKQKQVYVSHEGPIAVADKKLYETKYKDLVKDKNVDFKQVSGWIAIGDKYWLTSIIPQNSSTEKFDIAFKYYQKDGADRFQTDILSSTQTVAPGSKQEYSYSVYTGAKQIKIIENYKEKLNIDLFDRTIDFGGLYFITKPMLNALIYFHSLVGNMGLAIMLLTICVRLLLFPLANKSYGSMARMKKHMPEINKLKERFKSDRQKQGIEMMKYYKEHKINPAAGCLPIFVQIPVFFSLYKVLYITIDMRHEPFFWFIHDLSAQDPTNIFTLFGLVAWQVPAILPHIGILPILFSTSMMLQQRLNPPMADETQKVIMAWMPWIMLFVFAKFAAGLVVYWIWNNTLSIIQQYIITRRVEENKNE